MINSHALRVVVLSSACLATLGIVIFLDLPGETRLAAVLQDSGHAPAFGLVALLLFGLQAQRLRERSLLARYAIAAIGALLLGIGVELAQSFLDRDVSGEDVLRDGLGIVTALGLLAVARPTLGPRRSMSRLLIAASSLACAALVVAPVLECLAAYHDRAARFPVLIAPPYDLYFIRPTDPPLERQPVPGVAQGGPNELMLVVPDSESPWPGVVLDEPEPDWSAYGTLAIDVSNPDAAAIRLLVVVHDQLYDDTAADRYNAHYVLPGHSRRVLRISLASIAAGPLDRRLDLEHIGRLAIAHEPGSRQNPFLLAAVWLER